MTMLKNVSLMLLICLSAQLLLTPVYAEEQVAAVTASTDVEATMKSMSFAYKKAMAATDVAQMQQQITELQQLLASVQLVQFNEDRQQKFQQGFKEVQAQLALVQTSLAGADLQTAKQQLQQVDVLKKQYHKERSPSFWQLLFGK
ncbi:MAG: hypothetical protein KKB45_00470 [Gammaproteobacteria bacterium]|jgi:soluble cytochrome b562|nr:hypothetical protein [Gammaproteobacteria bacterium]MBU2428059.1 hypothetical protein [Gammaproteobacteria bacterium]